MIHLSDFTPASVANAFSVHPKAVAAGLRKLADQIERNEVIPQGVRLKSRAKIDDFAMSRLTVTFHEPNRP